ncbi:MAG: ECF transporter S component [Lachnospiraceae bacterium]|nr:ECF transporter S component [Lachnospiraceae bacterium]
MKISAKQITLTAAMLAICIISQFFKNTSVFITGPIINAALIIVTVFCGLLCGVILSVITPITSFFITGSPVMSAVPLMFPCIILGNMVLVCMVYILRDHFGKAGLPVSMALGSICKGAVMGLLIALIILPTFLPPKMAPMLPVLQKQFSLVQFITALIGSLYAFIIIQALSKSKVME